MRGKVASVKSAKKKLEKISLLKTMPAGCGKHEIVAEQTKLTGWQIDAG